MSLISVKAPKGVPTILQDRAFRDGTASPRRREQGRAAGPQAVPAAWQRPSAGHLVARFARLVSYPLRVIAAQRELEELGRMNEHELKDIGLTRQDLGDVTALPFDASPTEFLAARIDERYCARACTQRRAEAADRT
jgi:uncharacterized protein YjiS (DUF1127 family)